MKENFWPIAIATVLGFIFSIGYLYIEQQGYFVPDDKDAVTHPVQPDTVPPVLLANNESANTTDARPLQIASNSRDPGGITPDLSFDIKYTYRPKTGSKFTTLTDNTVLHSGDYYKIIFTPSETAYVYIFQQGSSGNIFRLFPMKSFGGVTVNNFNPVQPGIKYYIPAKGKSFFLDEQTGTEKLYFITSRQKDEMLENQYKQVLVARRGNDTKSIQLTQATLTKSIKNRDPGGIKTDPTQTETFTISDKQGQQFTVIRDRLKSCDGCKSEVTFQHK